jgi:D-methionine transport system substrate-binding protein
VKKTLLAALAVVPLAALLAGCAGGAGAEDDVVTIGVVGASDPYWADYTEAAAAEGIEVEIVDFADYAQPNPALAAGELDLNQFQHIVYLAEYNVASKQDLAPIGATAIYPLGLYSTKHNDLADIRKGDTVAVPNDASNLARALLVLQSAKLITLEGGGSIFSTLDDIDESKSKVTV